MRAKRAGGGRFKLSPSSDLHHHFRSGDISALL